ncbi:DUF433 domain-containing protein [Streptomonospora litoralis]|uniref:HTH merR-type domain-containing protein n=1 Tax=Streptomonospora litoralis TaxID=2498135 RepID=A0A4P6Q7F9_9ACTN|nr:DUF433 domain-containing protein [Streptomonospora litoralis]QBI54757.1 hypothetical protein EKD16_14890 [Streptomonospora litoralis]
MAFPIKLASVLTGATVAQLHRWRRDLLTPEVGTDPYLYSFRDLVALRSFVKLRTDVSLQAIRKALNQLRDLDLTDHPSVYELRTDGRSVYLVDDDAVTDLVKRPGQSLLLNLENVFAPFENFRGDPVVDFRRPRRHLHVSEHRLAGWPTVENTRIPFDTIAKLVSSGDIGFADVAHFYPDVSAAAAYDALDLQSQVESVEARAA